MKRARTVLSVLLAILLLASCLPMSAWAAEDAADEPIESAFTDPLFLNEVRKLVGKTNGEHIYRSDVENITKLEVNMIHDEKYKHIASLQGIEYFTELKELYCYCNDFQELDLSHNTKLEFLDASFNVYMTSLNVSNCPKLKWLECNYTALESVDLSKNAELTVLIFFSSFLKTIDVSHNPLLEKLDVYDCHLTNLDVSNNRRLQWLDCSYNDMCTVESIIGLENCTELEEEYFWFEPQNTVRTGHEWDDGTITAQPGCTEKGERAYTCINCKMTRTEEVAATGHQWDAWVITAKPSLTTTGTAEHICTKDRSHIESVKLPVLTDTTVWTKGEIVDDTQEYHSIYGTVTVMVSSPGENNFLSTPKDEQLPFVDVKESDWFYDAVAFVYEHDLLLGTEKTFFSPNEPLSRAMLVQILYNLEDKPAAAGTGGFTDVSASAWYADAVAWAAANKIVAGNDNGTFAPESAITREQIAVIFRNYTEFKGQSVAVSGSLAGFTDGAKTSDWATDAMQWAVGTGLFSGKENGILDPVGNSTRAEAAVVLMKFLT